MKSISSRLDILVNPPSAGCTSTKLFTSCPICARTWDRLGDRLGRFEEFPERTRPISSSRCLLCSDDIRTRETDGTPDCADSFWPRRTARTPEVCHLLLRDGIEEAGKETIIRFTERSNWAIIIEAVSTHHWPWVVSRPGRRITDRYLRTNCVWITPSPSLHRASYSAEHRQQNNELHSSKKFCALNLCNNWFFVVVNLVRSRTLVQLEWFYPFEDRSFMQKFLETHSGNHLPAAITAV